MALKKSLGRSTVWMSAAATATSLISFFIFIVLSRLLAPEEIGLVAFGLVVVEVGKVVVNAGFPQALVQREHWDDVYASTCFYLNMLFALSVMLLALWVGAPLATHYYDPAAGPILQVLSLIFLMEGLKAVHEGKLTREFAFKVIALRVVVGGLISGVVGIYLAFGGYGVWALVVQQLLLNAIVMLVTVISANWMPRLIFSKAACRRLLHFSTPLMLAQVIGNLGAKIFDVLIGLVIGPAALGFFRVAGRAVYILLETVLKPFEQPLLSVLSRIPEREKQAEGTLRVIRISAFLVLPFFFGAAAVAPEFIILTFGQKWEASGNIMMILALGTAPLVVDHHIIGALTATGKSRLVMALASAVCVFNCIIALSVVPFGLTAAACGLGIRTYLTVFFSMFLFSKVFKVSVLNIARLVAPAFLASALMFALVMLLKLKVTSAMHPALSLGLLCLAGAVCYVALMTIVFRAETKNLFREGADLIPQNFLPASATVQRLFRL